MVKVVVAGSRTFTDYELLKSTLDSLLMDKIDVTIVSGRAAGADRLGERYAKERGYSVAMFPADWEGLGKRAGYVRNGDMARFSDVLVAFWDGKSKGTGHMIDLARSYGLEVWVINY